jgi:glycosyltransferase involved in cell wall biosynthesis
VIDDIAMRRPWNLRVKRARLSARTRLRRLEDGVTVIIVNWNTRDVTADVVRTVQRLSPSDVRILVVDNGSNDGSAATFRDWAGVTLMELPSNAGHGVALDLGVCATRTKVAVTLDSDAIPLAEGWLDRAVEPVASGRAVLAGLRSSRNFVHPVYSAVDTAEFVRRKLSFQVHRLPDVDGNERWGENAWDTGELMTSRLEPDEVVFVEPTDNAAPGLPGMTTGGVVYHHGGVSRAVDGVVADDALEGWRAACRSLGVDVEVSQPDEVRS